MYKNFSMGSTDPSKLKPNPWNSNHLSPENEAKLDESIKRRGMFKPVVVRELSDGSLQILGGEHRSQSAARIGLGEIPYINLGRIDDVQAKEISLLDNSRYGTDDALQLAEVLESLGGVDDLATFMPLTEADFASIFSSVNIELDSLDLTGEDDGPTPTPQERPLQTHQIMRFKVPVEDVALVTKAIERVIKEQKFNDRDSLTNAGDALVHIFANIESD